MTAALLLTAVLQTAPVTKDFGIMRADRLVKAVAAATALPVEAPSFKLDYLYVNVREMPPESLLASLAKVLHGRWVGTGSKTVLRPNEPLDDPEGAEAAALAKSWFAQAVPKAATEDMIKKAVEMAKTLKDDEEPTPEQNAFFEAVSAAEPGQRAGARLVQALGLDAVRLGKGERRVYSSLPTANQFRLPIGSDGILSDLALESERYRRLAVSFVKTMAARPQAGMQEDDSYVEQVRSYQAVASGRFRLELAIQREAGVVTAKASITSLADSSLLDEEDLVLVPEQKTTPDSRPRPAFDLGLKGKTFLVPESLPRLREAGSGSTSKPVDPRITEAVEDPAGHDLLGLTQGPIMDEMSRQLDRGLICLVPDQAAARPLGKSLNLATEAAWLRYGSYPDDVKVEESGLNTLVVLARNSAMRADRFNREEVAALLKRDRTGLSWLANLSAYAAGLKGATPTRLSQLLIWRLTGRSCPASQTSPWTLLRCFEALGPQDRLAAQSSEGSVLSFGRLPFAMQRDGLLLNWGVGTRLLSLDPPAPTPEEEKPGWDRTRVDEFADQRRDAWQDADYSDEDGVETTRGLAQPVGSDSVIRFTVRTAQSLFLDVNGTRQPADPNTVAYLLHGAESIPPAAVHFVPGRSTLLRAECLHPRRGKVVRQVVIDEPDRNAKPIGMAEAPESFRRAVDDAAKRRRNSGGTEDLLPPALASPPQP